MALGRKGPRGQVAVRRQQAPGSGVAAADASPGRPEPSRAVQRAFCPVNRGRCNDRGRSRRGGCVDAVGSRWFRHAGGMSPISLAEPTGRHLSFLVRDGQALATGRSPFRCLSPLHIFTTIPMSGRGTRTHPSSVARYPEGAGGSLNMDARRVAPLSPLDLYEGQSAVNRGTAVGSPRCHQTTCRQRVIKTTASVRGPPVTQGSERAEPGRVWSGQVGYDTESVSRPAKGGAVSRSL